MKIKSTTIFLWMFLTLLIAPVSVGQEQNHTSRMMNVHLGQAKVDEIVSKIKKVLPHGWEVKNTQENEVPDLWSRVPKQSEKYKGYKITLEDPKHTFEKSSKVSSMKFKYHPFFTLWFIPLSGELTLDKAIADYKTLPKTQIMGQGVLVIAQLYGASDQYLLMYKESDRSSWENGLAQIANQFGIKPTQEK